MFQDEKLKAPRRFQLEKSKLQNFIFSHHLFASSASFKQQLFDLSKLIICLISKLKNSIQCNMPRHYIYAPAKTIREKVSLNFEISSLSQQRQHRFSIKQKLLVLFRLKKFSITRSEISSNNFLKV